jgi:hypothetical protein
MSPPEFATTVRRGSLDAATQRECRDLESSILELEQAERLTPAASTLAIQTRLLLLRKRYKVRAC